ncbi:MAG: hypothetical protein NTV08_16225 [Verrucomicrobia bacterium]|nr:hypothetical protein [Verrucomicrobiota bacterium]
MTIVLHTNLHLIDLTVGTTLRALFHSGLGNSTFCPGKITI